MGRVFVRRNDYFSSFDQAVTEKAKKNADRMQFLLDFPIEKSNFLGYNIRIELLHMQSALPREGIIGGNRK